jgi:photosystem II stability/assembly factor-like uncharacterized protein
MKTLALLSLFILPFSMAAQWVKTAGPVETSATTVEPAGTFLFLGTNGNGVFNSSDSGAHWSQVTSFPDSAAKKTVNRIVYHANTVYVATSDHIYSSIDNGATFQYGDTSLPDTLHNYNLFNVNGLLYATGQLVNPTTFNTQTQLYYFNDFTALWQQVHNLPAGAQVTGVAALHDTLYCAIFGHGLYTTHNNGFMWDSLNVTNGLLGSNNIRLLTADGQKLYAIAYDNNPSIYTSTNGHSWSSTLLSFTGGNTITTIAAANKVVCLGSPGVIYISKNDGASWMSTNFTYYSINEAKFLGTKIIAADPGNGFLRTDNDSIWAIMNIGLNYSTPLHLANPYSSLYAMDAYNTFHTTNKGSSWLQDTSKLFNMSAIARMGNKIIGFSKYGQNDLYSLNQGQTWNVEQTPGVGILVNRALVDNDKRQIYAWGQADIRRSDDYGKTWKSLFYPNANSYHDTLFTSMARYGTRLWATITDPAPKLIYSDDEGNHWTYGNLGYPVYHVEIIDSVPLIGTSTGIRRSFDDGASFTNVYGGDFFTTYVNGSTIFNYKGPFPNSIQFSTTFGATWTDISLPANAAGNVNDIIMDDTYLYAATSNHSVWKISISSLNLTYTPDTSNNYTINVGVNLLSANEQPVISVYPNPFSNNFNISVTTAATHYIDVKLYDVAGRLVQVVAQGTYPQGAHTFPATTNIPSGVYYITAVVDGTIITRKVVRY